MSEVEKARELLERERHQVLAALGEAGKEARKLSERQKEWRAEVSLMLERGRAAGVSITEMAKTLGLSRQWTTYLAKADRDEVLAKLHSEYRLARRGSSLVQERRPLEET